MAEKPQDKRRRKKTAGEKPNRTILRRTLMLMTVCGVVAFFVLAIKLYQLQIVKHDYYEKQAVEQQTRESSVTAARGTIYDTNGKALAMSASTETVFISPIEMNKYNEDKNLIASNLSEILGVDKDAVLKQMEDTKSWYKTIKRKIEKDVSDKVRQFVKDNKLKSVHLETDSKRYYPNSSLASHIIGFVGADNQGLDGLELQYNKYLEGTNGRIVRLKNAQGTDMLFSDFEDYYDARNGDDITLTVDSTIQFYVEKYLQQAIKDYDIQSGAAAIVMQPKTGAILAMASFGNYDPNNYQAVSQEEQAKLDAITDPAEKQKEQVAAQQLQWRNKALVDTYEPGSVFKIITCATALEEGAVTLNSTFYCGGSMNVLGRTIPLKCWKTTGHGSETLTEAMENSCNVALATIGLKVGAETYYKYVDAFGLREKTGIDLPGESLGLWWDNKTFENPENLSQLAAASFGQTFRITPMQMITAVSAVVNGGNLMKPYVVKQITDADGKVVLANEPTTVRQVISSQTSEEMRSILDAVVNDAKGTGKNAAVPGYRVGGKTGTSTDTVYLQQTGQKKYIVSFLGVAPMDDPQVAILLLLDNPSSKSGIYISGGNMAAPVVGHIMSEVLPYLGIQPVYTDQEKKELDVTVPKLAGKSIDEATEQLESLGLTAKVVGKGDTITDQLPAANAAVAPKSQIVLYAGTEKPSDTVTVPELYGKSFNDAKRALEKLGLFIKSGGTLSESPNAVVSTQSISKSEQVTAGTVVEVTLVDKSILGQY
ncbi:stage V sporulation protein D (sporulation-specific penicillin-binding protein) [Sporobacter termitidis DSM 10068]|uniref:Stage V sporulation protein D (Sporulation-specific penicillin-binding protein) n=1 Tax=Sporobacter termitidis DSM 10068 TaxID=1123282 RepID=A0A1M5WZ05_9FIRM|nr:penicillin-binding transpeptidase domain-containing protein [Sporobacter termitidis]SHH92849.1 stage V sporulation protein D (sporulation-specific penicillin-binding protein) [Sporobacter termitidis DSM 10068]